MEMKPEIVSGLFKRHADTDRLMDALRKVPVGETITYQALSDVVGVDVRQHRRAQLDTARDCLEREEKIAFECIQSVGLKRIEGRAVIDTQRAFRRRVKSMASKQERRLGCVGNLAELSNEDLRAFNVAASVVGMFRHISSEKAQNKIESRMENDQERLPVAKVLEFFK